MFVLNGIAVATVCLGIVALMRMLLIAIVVVWSFRADEAGREHALAVLRLLGASKWSWRLPAIRAIASTRIATASAKPIVIRIEIRCPFRTREQQHSRTSGRRRIGPVTCTRPTRS